MCQQLTKVLAVENTCNHAGMSPGDAQHHTYSHLQKEGETVIVGPVLMHLDGQTPSQNGNNADTLLRENEIISVRTLSW